MFDKARLKQVAKQYHLDLIVMFGSQVQGRARPDSDLDVAIRAYKEGWVGERRVRIWEWNLDVIGAVANVFDVNCEVDVSFLNRAAPLFLYEVATQGKVLYEKEPGDFAKFYSYAMRRYFDNEKFFRMTQAYLERNYGERSRTKTRRRKAPQSQNVRA